MSYILDALKKSESERQLQNAPGIADVPVQTSGPAIPAWVWLLFALLAINAVVLVGLLMRGNAQAPTATVATAGSAAIEAPAVTIADATPPAAAAAQSETPSLPSPVRRKSLAGIAEAPAQPPSAPATSTPAADPQPPQPPEKRQTAAAPAAVTPLPTLMDLRANGRVQLPDLHLDVHVYSGSPQDRFVFINMSKYREQARLAEGPLLTEIRQDGVVLEYQGRTFLLPRE